MIQRTEMSSIFLNSLVWNFSEFMDSDIFHTLLSLMICTIIIMENQNQIPSASKRSTQFPHYGFSVIVFQDISRSKRPEIYV